MNSIKERFQTLRENYTVANAIKYVDFLDECSKSDIVKCFESTFVEPIKGAEFSKKFILINSFTENELNMMKTSMESFIQKAESTLYENGSHIDEVRECINIIEAKLECAEHTNLVDLVLESFYLDDMEITCESKDVSDRTIKQIISKDIDDETKVKLANKLVDRLKRDSVPLDAVNAVNVLVGTTAIVVYYAIYVPVTVIASLLPLPIVIASKLINDSTKAGNISIYKKVISSEIKKVEAAQKSGKETADIETYRQNLIKAKAILNDAKKVTLESTLMSLDDIETVHEKVNILDSAIRENFVKFALSEDETIEESVVWLNNIIALSNTRDLIVEQLTQPACESFSDRYVTESSSKDSEDSKRLSYLMYLKNNGISIEEYRKTFKPKLIKYHQDISIRLKHLAKTDKSLNPDEIDFLTDSPQEYKKFLNLIDEYSSLKQKDYVMKNLPIVDVDAYEERENKNYLKKAERMAKDIITSADKDSFKIINQSGGLHITCTEWIYDAKALESEIKSLESKVGPVKESSDLDLLDELEDEFCEDLDELEDIFIEEDELDEDDFIGEGVISNIFKDTRIQYADFDKTYRKDLLDIAKACKDKATLMSKMSSYKKIEDADYVAREHKTDKDSVDSGNFDVYTLYDRYTAIAINVMSGQDAITTKCGQDVLKELDRFLNTAFKNKLKDKDGNDVIKIDTGDGDEGCIYIDYVGGNLGFTVKEIKYKVFEGTTEYIVEEGSKSDEVRKKVNVTSNKIKSQAHKLKANAKKAGQGTKAAMHQVGKAGKALDDAATNTVNKAKGVYRNDIREEIIEDKTRIKLFRIIRKGVGLGVATMVNPVLGAITGLTSYALGKKVKEKERRRILQELNEELEIVNEKIEDARGDSNKEKKYNLMRIRNQLQRDITRIQYRIKSDGKGV